MDPNYLIKGANRKGPFISFHDGKIMLILDKNYKIDVNEIIGLSGNEASRIEKLDIYYNDLEGDYKQIAGKCERIIKEYYAGF